MHPIVLLLIAGAGAYLLWDSLGDETQGLPAPNGNKIVVPVIGDKPKESVTDVPPPAGNGPQAVYQPPAPKSNPEKSPVLVTPSGVTNFHVQTMADVQRALNAIGVVAIPIAADGKFNQATQKAVKVIQKQFDLPVTGTPDFPTRKAIEAAIGNLAVAGPPVGLYPTVQKATAATAKRLAQGASQLSVSDVSGIQRALNAIGAKPPLKIDNIQGPKTTAAIKAFQITQGLVADGVVGPKTITALQAAVDPKAMNAIASANPDVFHGDFGGRKKGRSRKVA